MVQLLCWILLISLLILLWCRSSLCLCWLLVIMWVEVWINGVICVLIRQILLLCMQVQVLMMLLCLVWIDLIFQFCRVRLVLKWFLMWYLWWVCLLSVMVLLVVVFFVLFLLLFLFMFVLFLIWVFLVDLLVYQYCCMLIICCSVLVEYLVVCMFDLVNDIDVYLCCFCWCLVLQILEFVLDCLVVCLDLGLGLFLIWFMIENVLQ